MPERLLIERADMVRKKILGTKEDEII